MEKHLVKADFFTPARHWRPSLWRGWPPQGPWGSKLPLGGRPRRLVMASQVPRLGEPRRRGCGPLRKWSHPAGREGTGSVLWLRHPVAQALCRAPALPGHFMLNSEATTGVIVPVLLPRTRRSGPTDGVSQSVAKWGLEAQCPRPLSCALGG